MKTVSVPSRMRIYIRTFSLCIVIALLSLLFLFSKHDAESFLKQMMAPHEPSDAKNLNGAKAKQRATATRSHRLRDAAHKVNSPGQRETLMQLAVVACGERYGEAVNMLKTAAMLSSKDLRFHIFAEEQLHTNIKSAMILSEVDSLLYVDTDVLFLQPVELIWDVLLLFNSTQLVAVAPEHEEPRIAWYSRFSRHPYYGKTGINSGVMLMNLTRMRMAHFKNDMTSVGLHWGELLMPLLQKYKLNITWGDQDLINIIFHYNPEMVFTFPCHWNYRPDHCIYGSNCIPAEEGVVTLHGNRGVFHSDKQPSFMVVYDAFKHYTFGEDLVKSFLLPLEVELNGTTHTYCGKVSHFFTRGLGKSVRRIQRRTPPGG